MTKAITLASLLMDLQLLLRQLGHWQAERPSAQALASQQPFCVDTLSFPQWLQFVFIERLQLLLDQQLALPTSCQVCPMAEQYFAQDLVPVQALLACLRQIDGLLSEP